MINMSFTFAQIISILGLFLESVSVLWVIKEPLFYSYEQWYQWYIEGKGAFLKQQFLKKKKEARLISGLLALGIVLQVYAVLFP